MIVSFTGHRPEGLGDDLAGAWIAIKEFLMGSRPERVISGMAQGVDSIAFDIADELGIPVIAAVPWTGYGSLWPQEHQRQYLKRLERAERVHVVSQAEIYHQGIEQLRNRWMVDNSDTLVAVWNGVRKGGTWNCIEYCQKAGRSPVFLKWRSK